MLDWLRGNAATIIISIALLAAVLLAVRYLIRNAKAGKCAGCSGCSSGSNGGCSGCDSSGSGNGD